VAEIVRHRLGAGLRGDSPRDHVEACACPEQQAAHTYGAGVCDGARSVVPSGLLENVNHALSREQRQIRIRGQVEVKCCRTSRAGNEVRDGANQGLLLQLYLIGNDVPSRCRHGCRAFYLHALACHNGGRIKWEIRSSRNSA